MLEENRGRGSFNCHHITTLRCIQVKDVLTVNVFKGRLWRMPRNNLVIFRDRSDDLGGGSDASICVRSPYEVLNIFRFTFAGVMNMSGVGRFFDELLVKYMRARFPLSDPGQSWRK